MKTILGKKEIEVLWGLTRYPSRKDYEICELLEMKKSTFSSIKKRLKIGDYFRTVWVPMFRCIGCELLMVSYGLLNRTTTIKSRLAVAKSLLEEFAEFFFIFLSL